MSNNNNNNNNRTETMNIKAKLLDVDARILIEMDRLLDGYETEPTRLNRLEDEEGQLMAALRREG